MMKMMRNAGWVWCMGLLFAVGCSDAGKVPKLADTVPVEGTVKMDGQPLANASVFFHPKVASGFHGAIGVTDDSGKYVLESDIGNNKTKKGIIPGSYNVTVSRLVKPDGTIIKFDPDVPPMNVGAKEEIPLRYSTVNDQGLSYEVPSGGGKFDIEVTSQGETMP